MKPRLPAINMRSEAIYLALAAAETCWLAPLLLALTKIARPHPPLLLWLGIFVLLLGYFYFYRALVKANLSLKLQQTLLVVALLFSIILFLYFHIYANEPRGAWSLEQFFLLGDAASAAPGGWVTALVLIFFWLRGIHLAHRSIFIESVGFSFRSGIILLIAVTLFAHLFAGDDVAGFIISYFFFALIAVALARIEEVSRAPNSGRTAYDGFWLGSTVGAVTLLVLAATVVAVIFYGGGPEQLLIWLSPVIKVVGLVIFGVGMLIILLVKGIFFLLSIDLNALAEGLRGAFENLSQLLILPAPIPQTESKALTIPAILDVLQAVICIAIPATVILLVVLFTWQRARKHGQDARQESHESLLSAGAVTANLRAMIQSGLDRLGELAGLVDRFGLGSRFLSAISIRRIYANLVRLATEAGYPRAGTQTPYEYQETLREAFPGGEADVAVITAAYVNAHYGQTPDSRQELQRIRDSWERLRAGVSR